MVAHRPLTPKTERYPLPPDGPLMARLRVSDALRLALGGGSEDSDQRRTKILLDEMGLLWQHTPNEGKRDERERGSALARGLKRGVPDCIIYDPFDITIPDTGEVLRFAGLAFDLKRNDATACKVEDDQRRWGCELRARGWMWEWTRGFLETSKLIVAAYGQAAAKGGR